MATLFGIVAGVLVAGLLLGSGGILPGAFIGGLVGYAWSHRTRSDDGPQPGAVATAAGGRAGGTLEERLFALERRVEMLERATRGGDTAGSVAAPTEAFPPAAAAAADAVSIAAPATPLVPTAAAAEARAAMPAAASTVAEPGDAAPPEARPTLPSPPPNRLWAWVVGGNTPARVGVLLLFIGVGFLLKYAVEHVHVPISLRLSGVALGGIALLVVGWRLRVTRRAYAMVLQGGGVGVLYLTVFAALRLYALIPPVAAFALLIWISALASWLAVRQDAMSLAVLAVAGGFLAPILTSTDAGNHVLLFGYYALLNAGILGIAWFKAWRPLNLLGFAFTFLVGTFWGVTRYEPAHFATTEPFLVLFFVFYVAIAVLYALRRSVTLSDYVDAGLVFGTPLVAAGLQSALVRDYEYGMAWSALAMSALYLVLGRFLHARRRDDIRLLVESFLALGVGFATLAVPLALDARWTSAAWAVEGAAIAWAGVRMGRPLVRSAGVLLQAAAGIAFLLGFSLWRPGASPAAVPVANSAFVGALLVALAGLFTARMLGRQRPGAPVDAGGLAGVAFAWGALWWIAAGLREIDRFVPFDYRGAAVVAFLAATGVAFAFAERRLAWPLARVPALLLVPALLAVVAIGIGRDWHEAGHLFAHGGFVAWPVAVATVAALLFWFDRAASRGDAESTGVLEPLHAGFLWLLLLVAAQEAAWLGSRVDGSHGVWTAMPWGLVPALGIALVCALASGPGWPVGAHRRGYLVLGAAPVAVLVALWSAAASVHGAGDPAPLPYLPLANPLDLAQAIAIVALATWVVRVRREDASAFVALPGGAAGTLLGALAFLWINAVVLRAIHFWYGVAYTPAGLWNSTLVQATLSILWSLIALATMAFATRRAARAPWLAAAALLGIVVAKLFVVELAQVGTVTRIVSFIGVGLLLLLIGYLAPAPPRRKEESR